MEISLFVIILLATFGSSLLFSYFLVRSYADNRSSSSEFSPSRSSVFTTIICTLAILVTLFCVLLIPLDIYSVSSSLNADGSHSALSLMEDSRDFIRVLYYIFYSSFLVFAFLLLPFAYFFYESDEGESSKGALWSRISHALKWTAGFLVFFLVFMACGLVIRQGRKEGDDWKTRLSNEFTEGDAVLGFSMGALACLGLVFYVLYASYGLAGMPLRLMAAAKTSLTSSSELNEPILIKTRTGAKRKTKNIQTSDLSLELKRIQENINYLQAQMDGPINSWPSEERKQMETLQREKRQIESALQKRGRDIESGSGSSGRYNNYSATKNQDNQYDNSGASSSSSSSSSSSGSSSTTPRGYFISRIWNCLAPFRILFAIPLIGLSLLIVVSLSITVIDKFLHSNCGPSCGYILESPTILNPIDEALKQLSKAFPLDAIAFAGLCLYLYFTYIHSILALGVRILIWKLFTIRSKRTPPNALYMAIWVLMFLSLVLNLQILTFAPQYATFGNQFFLQPVYSNGTSTTTAAAVNNEAVNVLQLPLPSSPSFIPVDSVELSGLKRLNDLSAADPRPIIGYERTSCTVQQSQSSASESGSAGIPTDVCRMTAIASFLLTLSIQMPFFAVILFYSNLLFLALFIIFFFVALFRTKEEFGDYKPLTEEEKLDEDSD